MRLLYINNSGGGFADYLQIEEGKTVEQFFKDKMPSEVSTDYLIRVNRQPVPRDYVLQEGDRVTITSPTPGKSNPEDNNFEDAGLQRSNRYDFVWELRE